MRLYNKFDIYICQISLLLFDLSWSVSSSAWSPVNLVEYIAAQFTRVTCPSINHNCDQEADPLGESCNWYIGHNCTFIRYHQYQQIFSIGKILLPVVRIGA